MADRKRRAAERAVELVESGMTVGLGTGSTSAFAVVAIGRRLTEGSLEDIRGVPTSNRTREAALTAGIPLVEPDEVPRIDLTIDGADEVDRALDLLKGGGGALLREKIVAFASARNVIVVDERKLVDRLGTGAPLPVEVARFGWRSHVPFLSALGAEVRLRTADPGGPYATDEGHVLLDCRFAGGITDPLALQAELRARPGIVETGLFLGLAHEVVVGGREGVRILRRAGVGPRS